MVKIGDRYEDVKASWLNSRSEATKTAYQANVPEFFEMVLDKDMMEVTEEDINNLDKGKFYAKYIDVLKDNGLKNSTVKTKIAALKSFFKELSSYPEYQEINFNFLNNVLFSVKNLKDDTVNHTVMTEKDFNDMYVFLKNKKFPKTKTGLGERYAEAMKFMFYTGLRVDATFSNLTWSDFIWEADINGLYGWTIYTLDKGDKFTPKPISDEYYNHLKENFYDGNDDELVFKGLSKVVFQNCFSEFSKKYGRDLTAHSIRVGAATRVYSLTKDLVATQKFMGHSKPETTVRYIRTDNDRTKTGSFLMTVQPDLNRLNELSKDDLLRILQNERRDLGMAVLVACGKVG